MSSNGFHRSAPILPAMGLHSFNNDSPPFVGAATSDLVQPDDMSLHAFRTPPSRPVSSLTSNEEPIVPATTAKPTSTPNDIPYTAATSDRLPSNGHALPNSPSPNADEDLSSSRSRRLVSGYLFGNPPSPSTTRRNSPNEDIVQPSLAGDSPPLTETSDRVNLATPRPDSMPIMQDSRMTMFGSQGVDQRPSSRSRDRETGYDALNGLNDGEADLDENAPQAAFGTEAYLKGDRGEAGSYRFPRHRLRKTMKDESKIPLIIVACGSFSPPTYLHLRMFEMAKDEIVESQTYEIMAGYYSPVSSYYKKAGLSPAIDRVRMCELAVEHTSTWLMVDPWEAGQSEYKRTAIVLDHFDQMVNIEGGGLTMSDGRRRKYKVMLLAGGDLIESFGEPGQWSEPDLHIILGRFGCLIVERAGSDVWAFLISHDLLYHHRRNVIVIKQLIYNDISSTKVRLFVRRGMSIKYLLPNSVIQYIYDHKLYREPDIKIVAA